MHSVEQVIMGTPLKTTQTHLQQRFYAGFLKPPSRGRDGGGQQPPLVPSSRL